MLILASQAADDEEIGSLKLAGWDEGVSSGAAASGVGSLKLAGWDRGASSRVE